MTPSCGARGSVSDALLRHFSVPSSENEGPNENQPRQKPLPGDAGEPSQSSSVYGPSITGQPSSITSSAAARDGAKFIWRAVPV